jgi:hypothetical protein
VTTDGQEFSQQKMWIEYRSTKEEEIRSIHKMEDYTKYRQLYTHTHYGSNMPLPYPYFIPMYSPYHTSMNSKREKKDSMDDDDERYSLPDVYIYAFSLESTFIFLSLFIILNEWTGMVFVIYLVCRNLIHIHIHSLI